MYLLIEDIFVQYKPDDKTFCQKIKDVIYVVGILIGVLMLYTKYNPKNYKNFWGFLLRFTTQIPFSTFFHYKDEKY